MPENQIQLYHDATAFWLEKDWKTPREKQLERQVAQLRQENSNLKAQGKALGEELERMKVRNKALAEELEPLKVFKDIPCCHCGWPMTNWTRIEVLRAFKNWHHARCG